MSVNPDSDSRDAIVVGAGIVGLACAWRLAREGRSVLCLDRSRAGGGASGVAAGMLAPVTEAEFGEEDLLRMNLDAAAAWPGFARDLAEASGIDTGFRESGALVVAADRDDAEELRRLHVFQRSLGLDAQWLTPSECRRLEPALSPRIAGGILAPQDNQADPAAVTGALAAALREEGGELREEAHVESVEPGAVTLAGGGRIPAGDVVVAAGAWSGSLASVAVRPVKGQLLRLRRRGGEPLASRIVRTPRCYVVDRGDGRVVIGATVEERGFDTEVTAEGVYRLLEAAYEVLPDVEELAFEGAVAGLRPGTPDNRPVVRRVDGVVVASGHFRNGVLLAPVAAAEVAALVGERVEALG
ncbi:MAG TPA: glycine oxidase ThiO [Thermoleophilaceae bacterium]|nr:glycine oxidase ThiO [Thermoleophilaceae bacterium]